MRSADSGLYVFGSVFVTTIFIICAASSSPPLSISCAAAIHTTPLARIAVRTAVNRQTLDLIKHAEGYVPVPSPDPLGVPTAGYGHQCRLPGCKEIQHMLPLSREAAEKLLQEDISIFAAALAQILVNHQSLNENQWGALVSWTYNVGTENARNSSLVKRLNMGQPPNDVAKEELPKWISSTVGQTLPGLVGRRAAEVALFCQPVL